MLGRTEQPLVVVAEGGVFKRHVRYLTSYRGLAFFTQTAEPLVLPRGAEVIDFAAQHLSTYKRLHKVEFISAVPKSASGKILRRELRTAH